MVTAVGQALCSLPLNALDVTSVDVPFFLLPRFD